MNYRRQKDWFAVTIIFSDGGSYNYQNSEGFYTRIKSGQEIIIHRNESILFNDLPEDVTYAIIMRDFDSMEDAQRYAQRKRKKKKANQPKNVFIYNFLEGILTVVLILVLCLVTFIKLNQNHLVPSFAGFSFSSATTNLMAPKIPQGSIIVTQKGDVNQLQIGDIISYKLDANATITHEIVDIMESYLDTNQPAFETKALNQEGQTTTVVPAANVVGKVVFHSVLFGTIVNFVDSYWLFISVGILAIFIFISYLKRRALKK